MFRDWPLKWQKGVESTSGGHQHSIKRWSGADFWVTEGDGRDPTRCFSRGPGWSSSGSRTLSARRASERCRRWCGLPRALCPSTAGWACQGLWRSLERPCFAGLKWFLASRWCIATSHPTAESQGRTSSTYDSVPWTQASAILSCGNSGRAILTCISLNYIKLLG